MSTALLGEQFLIFIYFYRIYPLKWKKPRVTVLKILSVFFEFVISYILNIILGPGQLRSSHIKFVDNKWNILFRSLFNVLLPIFNLPSIFLMKNNIIVTLLTLYTLLKKTAFLSTKYYRSKNNSPRSTLKWKMSENLDPICGRMKYGKKYFISFDAAMMRFSWKKKKNK